MMNIFCLQAISVLKLCVIVVAFLWFGVFAVPAVDHYVSPPGGHGTNNPPYTNWADAATNIQWAVNAASPGETVWVTNGPYCVTNQIIITNGITLKSMNGYSNTLVYADWPAYTTRCLYASNICVVDGFTFSNGHSYGVQTCDGGGGAFITRTAVVQNCYFVNNICSNAVTESGGGGVNAQYRSIVSNCTFVANTSYYAVYGSGNGGGVFLREARALNCTVISNVSDRSGGGIYSLPEWSAQFQIYNIISNCVIAYNSGYNGGGAFNGHAELVDCVITYNSAITAGGGVQNATLTRNCVISNNYAPAAGGILNLYLHPGVFISNCVITANRCGSGTAEYKGGGGVYVGAGFMRECQIFNNICAGSWGGGGVLITNNGSLINCLIYNNTNTSSTGNGGGVLLANASLTGGYNVINCTIVNNYSTNEGGGIAALGPSNLIVNSIIFGNGSASNLFPDVYNTGANSNNYWYSCATNVLFAPNQGNISVDPRLVDPGAGNWRLQAYSPCVNTGTNQDWMINSFDLGGGIRIRYGAVDMGAYETIYEGIIFKGW